jgi:hypothetical protein
MDYLGTDPSITVAHKETALATLNLVFSAINIVGIWRWLV